MSYKIASFFLLIIICICSGVKNDNIPNCEKSIVWAARENNVDGYRIPGIVVTKKGTALAFAEERPTMGDADIKSVVVKRSEDGGKTWSGNIYIEKCDGSFWSNHAKDIDPMDVPDKKEVWTNIAPIVDVQTGRVFFFYALSEGKVAEQNMQRYTRVYYKYSDDDGLTWSGRSEITDILNVKENGTLNVDENGKTITDVNGFPCDFLGRAFHMPGPGHGLQLSNGRLLLQVWNRTALSKLGEGEIPVTERKYGVCTVYSDDHGRTWEFGSAFGHNGLNMNESRMAELSNGDVYMNARYVNMESGSTDNKRITAISHDKGKTWTDIHVNDNFPSTNPCDGGVVVLPDDNVENNILLYSKNEFPGKRSNLVIRMSYNDGKSWPVAKVVDEGPAWYSDLAVLPDKTILLIYETGKDRPVYCVRLNQEWIESK